MALTERVMNMKLWLYDSVTKVKLFTNILCYSISDIATVFGYLVVSRPFLDLAHPRHLNSSHSERLEVSVAMVTDCISFCGLILVTKLSTHGYSSSLTFQQFTW